MTIDPSQYARWRASPLGSTTEALEQGVVFDLAGPLSGKRVLDVGCGDGTYTLGAAERGAQVVGIDTSSEMVAASKRRASEKNVNIELLIADVTKLPFAAARFDVVLAVTVLCFVADVNIAVRELVRVLVPGGRVVRGELGRRSTWAAWRRLRGWLGSRAWRAATFRTAAELRTLVEQAGLSVEQVRGSIYYPPVMSLARWMAPLDAKLGRLTPEGAAFIAVVGVSTKEAEA
jgi:ubiquinone biosynthesis O-methyltransferase